MLCQNCNRSIAEGVKTCPYCNAKIDNKIIRCPNCWTKHESGTEICGKCGCNIPKTIKENEESANYRAPSVWDRIKVLPLWVKISVPSIFAVILAVCVVFAVSIHISNAAKVAELTEEFLTMAEDAVDSITVIAEHYENDVYNKDWITHIETAQELREKYAPQIEEIKKTREPVGYGRDRIKELASERVCTMADDVYYGYVECYAYVIGENGKYPHYLKKYMELIDDFNLSVKELKEEIAK